MMQSRKIASCLTVPLGKLIQKSQYGHSKVASETGTSPVLGMRNIKDGQLDLSSITMSELSSRDASFYELKQNDLLFNRTNSSDLVGKVALFTGPPGFTFASYLIRLQVGDNISAAYVCCYLQSQHGYRQIKRLATPGVGQYNVNPTQLLRHVKIPLPSTEIQKKIVIISSFFDQILAESSALVNAKRRLKQGLMQQLLTGKKRFSEFAGTEWKQVHLGDVFQETTHRNTNNEDLEVLSCSKVHGIIAQTKIFGKRLASEDTSRYKVVQCGDLVYDPMLLWDASLGFVKEYQTGIVSPAYNTFTVKDWKFPLSYLEELFNTPYIRHMYKSISQGTNTRRKKAPASAFLAIPVQVPSDPQEGKKITEVAETLQLEIKLLEQQLALLQKQKRALMEQLLTGKLMVSGLETVHE